MLSLFFEKTLERNLFTFCLSRYGLGPNDLEASVFKKILGCIHTQIGVVSKKYRQPSAVILHNVVTPAAWATAYCLLGPSRVLHIDPAFQENIDEVEMELLLLSAGEDGGEHNIYRQVFSILLDSTACHPEVVAKQRGFGCGRINRENPSRCLKAGCFP